MYDRLLGSFVPHIYKDVTEMDAIIDAEQRQLSSAQTEASQAFANTFVLTANYEGIEMFEMMLGIIADPTTESMEFLLPRRSRSDSLKSDWTTLSERVHGMLMWISTTILCTLSLPH